MHVLDQLVSGSRKTLGLLLGGVMFALAVTAARTLQDLFHPGLNSQTGLLLTGTIAILGSRILAQGDTQAPWKEVAAVVLVLAGFLVLGDVTLEMFDPLLLVWFVLTGGGAVLTGRWAWALWQEEEEAE